MSVVLTNLSPIGWMLEMVTSVSLGSSFSRAQEEEKEAEPESESHREPKLSPVVKGLSLYLPWHNTHTQDFEGKNFHCTCKKKTRTEFRFGATHFLCTWQYMLCDTVNNQHLPVCLLKHDVALGMLGDKQVCWLTAQPCHLLWWSRGKPRLIKHVQSGARGGLWVHGGLLLNHLHLWHHRVWHNTGEERNKKTRCTSFIFFTLARQSVETISRSVFKPSSAYSALFLSHPAHQGLLTNPLTCSVSNICFFSLATTYFSHINIYLIMYTLTPKGVKQMLNLWC